MRSIYARKTYCIERQTKIDKKRRNLWTKICQFVSIAHIQRKTLVYDLKLSQNIEQMEANQSTLPWLVQAVFQWPFSFPVELHNKPSSIKSQFLQMKNIFKAMWWSFGCFSCGETCFALKIIQCSQNPQHSSHVIGDLRLS